MLRQSCLGFFDIRVTECLSKWKIRGNFQDFQNFTVNTLDYSEISCIMSCELLNK